MSQEGSSAPSGFGPDEMTQAQRLAVAREISDRLRQHYGDRVKAVGIFGSVARETDGPYSDVELYCILDGKNVEDAYEWATGTWKALVNIYSEDVMIRDAAVVDETWPVVQSGYVYVKPLYDPSGIFVRVREVALMDRPDEFKMHIQKLIAGELYETIGKIRNAHALKVGAALPLLAFELTKHGAALIGLINRHLYISFSTHLQEASELPDKPEGYDALCNLVLSGKLDDFEAIVNRANGFWEGIESWAVQNEVQIYTTLDDILDKK